MKKNEEDIISQNSTEKTSTSSYNDDTYFQEVNNPFFPKIRPRVAGNSLSNSSKPGSKTVYISSSKIKEAKNKKGHKFLFFGKSKDNGKNNSINDDDDNFRIENDYNNKIFETKKLKNKRLTKKNTINFISPANEFQKTTLEKNILIEDNNLESNFGISLKPLEEQWKYQKILLDYNILDFTSKSK